MMNKLAIFGLILGITALSSCSSTQEGDQSATRVTAPRAQPTIQPSVVAGGFVEVMVITDRSASVLSESRAIRGTAMRTEWRFLTHKWNIGEATLDVIDKVLGKDYIEVTKEKYFPADLHARRWKSVHFAINASVLDLMPEPSPVTLFFDDNSVLRGILK
jgi:hypothetical protein